MKKFIITVDTEPDGQWDTQAEETTRNARYIPRFQELCDKYGFKPVYLTDFAMTQDNYFVELIKSYLKKGSCEVGMHLHAWDTPPIIEFDKMAGNRPYLIEYEYDVMEEKIKTLTERLETVFEMPMISHRAGRWALDERYIELLSKYGYKIDCSVTPHINWNSVLGKGIGAHGSDYSSFQEGLYYLENSPILEVPVTVKSMGRLTAIRNGGTNIKQFIKHIIRGENYWFRPALFSFKQMKALYSVTKNDEYIEMMLHSSELMPGGSPYFPNEKSIEDLYGTLELLFDLVSKTHVGYTLKELFEEEE